MEKRNSYIKLFLLLILIIHFTNLLNAKPTCNCSLYNEAKKQITDAQVLIKSAEPACKIKGYELFAKELFKRKQLDSAEQYLNQSLAILKKENCQPQSFLDTYKLFANLYNNRADFEKQLDIELKISGILETMKDTVSLAMSLLNISDVFNRMEQADKGIVYCRKAIPIIMQLTSPSDKASLLTKAAKRYYFYYEQYNDKKFLDTMELYTNAAYTIMKSTPIDRKIQFMVYTKLITIAIEKKSYTTALEYIDNNLKLCERDKDIPELAVNFSDKAEVYFNLGEYEQAKKWADSSLVYTKLTQSPPHIANVYNLLYRIAGKTGNAKEALQALENERALTDSLNNIEKVEMINELEKKYNQAKNEKTIKELSLQKQIYFLFAIAAMLGIIAIAFFFRQQSLNHKKSILEVEQRLNRARMNPHFFFNALASLQNFAVSENNGEAIASNLSKFSHIMRETLESTYKEYVTVEQEMDFLNEYLDVQKMRFPKKFNHKIVADKNVEVDEIQLPAMIIQPFVENSIEHGFSNIDYNGEINIHFSKTDANLLIEIIDNGKGLSTNIKENNEHISRASQIIKDRIYLLNIKLKTKASFSIDNNSNGKGVIVKIFLPLIYIDQK